MIIPAASDTMPCPHALHSLLRPFHPRYQRQPLGGYGKALLKRLAFVEQHSYEAMQLLLSSFNKALCALWRLAYLAIEVLGPRQQGSILPLLSWGLILLATAAILARAVAFVVIFGGTALCVTGYIYAFCAGCRLSSSWLSTLWHSFWGQDIASTAQNDQHQITTAMALLTAEAGMKPGENERQWAKRSHKQLRYQRSQISTILEKHLFSTSDHLYEIQAGLIELCETEITEKICHLQQWSCAQFTLIEPQTQEQWLSVYQHYPQHLSDYDDSVLLATIQEHEPPPWQMLRDRLPGLFLSLPSNQPSASHEIQWQSGLCEILKAEAAHWHGQALVGSPVFQRWLWWVQDKMNGLDTPPPEQECAYFTQDYPQLWGNVRQQPAPPVILSTAELTHPLLNEGAPHENFRPRSPQSVAEQRI